MNSPVLGPGTQQLSLFAPLSTLAVGLRGGSFPNTKGLGDFGLWVWVFRFRGFWGSEIEDWSVGGV